MPGAGIPGLPGGGISSGGGAIQPNLSSTAKSGDARSGNSISFQGANYKATPNSNTQLLMYGGMLVAGLVVAKLFLKK